MSLQSLFDPPAPPTEYGAVRDAPNDTVALHATPPRRRASARRRALAADAIGGLLAFLPPAWVARATMTRRA